MRRILFTLFALIFATAAYAQAPPSIFKVYAGANAVTFDGHQFPSDFELGGTGRASLSPHISAVGGLFYGLNHQYVTFTGGGRVTITDVSDPNFSIGLGLEHRSCSQTKLRPEEWDGTVSVGWVPVPQTYPRLILGLQGGYGLKTHTGNGMAVVRYELGTGL